MVATGDNPYLAHLPPSQRGVEPSRSIPSDKEPLYGFLPRKVKGAQARKAMVSQALFLLHPRGFSIFCWKEHDINPFTKQPLSAQYKKILESRKKLPVYAKMDEFFEMVRIHNLLEEEGLRSASF